MRICFLGSSHAATHLAAAAAGKGFGLVGLKDDPALVFVSEDMPTDSNGARDVRPIHGLAFQALTNTKHIPVVLTSQVEPGFTRSLGPSSLSRLFHQSETLRIKDAVERANNPEMFIVGCEFPNKPLPKEYETYLHAFNCPVLTMSYESAEFAKMAINAFLISQVETTNMLSRLADRCGAKWSDVQRALWNDSRIGPNAYLEPGRWQDSKHLMRDYVSLCELDGDVYPDQLLAALDL